MAGLYGPLVAPKKGTNREVHRIRDQERGLKVATVRLMEACWEGGGGSCIGGGVGHPGSRVTLAFPPTCMAHPWRCSDSLLNPQGLCWLCYLWSHVHSIRVLMNTGRYLVIPADACQPAFGWDLQFSLPCSPKYKLGQNFCWLLGLIAFSLCALSEGAVCIKFFPKH